MCTTSSCSYIFNQDPVLGVRLWKTPSVSGTTGRPWDIGSPGPKRKFVKSISTRVLFWDVWWNSLPYSQSFVQFVDCIVTFPTFVVLSME